MPLEAQKPQLDTRTFEDIKAQAKLRIPRYTPEWTDFNESDPGITMVELFAWLTELMLYEMNRAPERSRVTFMQTLGLELQPAEPAEAHLYFTPAGGGIASPVPDGAQFGAQPPAGDLLIFETLEGLSPISLPLTDVQTFDGAAFQVVTELNKGASASFRPFGWLPQAGSALYLGFTPDPRIPAADVFPEAMSWRIFLPAANNAGQPLVCQRPAQEKPPQPPVRLIWEYKPAENQNVWRRLQVYDDASLAFTREGSLLVQGPGAVAATTEGRVDEARYWLRVRLAGPEVYPAGRAPEIDFLWPNIVRARNLATLRDEIVGISDGRPDQVFSLARRPVAPDTLILEVTDAEFEPGAAERLWQQVDDLLCSGEDDPHYTFNAVAGEIHFGDGRTGRIPPAGSEIVARRYRYGGGTAGNVAAGLINLPLSTLNGIGEVINPRPAAGGRNEESLDDFLRFAPARLRHRDRAVAVEDFAALAREVGGIGLAAALPLFHPDYRDTAVPGAVTLVIVPDNLDVLPLPSPDQIEAVCRYLNPRRLLTTELHVKGPEYTSIRVRAVVQVTPYASFDRVQAEIVRSINTALDPLGRDWQTLTGGSASGRPACAVALGGEIGHDLYPTSLYSVIQSVEHVRAITYLSVNGREYDGLRQPIKVPADGLVVGVADHEIEVRPYSEQR